MLSIKLDKDDGAFEPGESIIVTVAWDFREVPTEILVSLYWYTMGKGTEDMQIVEEKEVSRLSIRGEERLTFTAPKYPVTIHGELISILWAIEADATSFDDEPPREEIIIGPGGQPVKLPPTPELVERKKTKLIKMIESYGNRQKDKRTRESLSRR